MRHSDHDYYFLDTYTVTFIVINEGAHDKNINVIYKYMAAGANDFVVMATPKERGKKNLNYQYSFIYSYLIKILFGHSK